MESKGDYVRRKTMERLKDNPDLCLMDFQDGILVGIKYNKENKMKDRSIKEVLEVMLNHQEHFSYGLCTWIGRLYSCDLITLEEHHILFKYMRNNKPKWYSSFSAFWAITSASAYYWEYNKIEPRIKWVKKHIKLNQ